ncbi:hypothetical protein SWZG_00203 [Synechococcus phage S-SKS1]|jgi:hypothetical protein|uniref:Uncharacterized protein n=1 Tax=Synechococcus phage S-SKS1 TaxID=754042 RepID=M4QTJ4_9CAUD|nr:hypothetical protein SWZG_00203 [Synechococcus phage S-SKS1]AGH31709.1 hypothetical protein SWZG_00203 [Synechococcus phage S-SKS1]
MTDLTFSGVFLTVEEHDCMYTVCSEGELFRVPFDQLVLNFDEFEIVDFWDDNVDAEQLEEIQSKLIDMMQIAGLYFKSQPIELS